MSVICNRKLSTRLFSSFKPDFDKEDYERVAEYVGDVVENRVDKDSEIGLAINQLKTIGMNTFQIIDYLVKSGRNMMITFDNKEIVGHIAYQVYPLDRIAKAFHHLALIEGNGIGTWNAVEFLRRGREYGLERARLSAGRNSKKPRLQIVIDRLHSMQDDLGIVIDTETHWVDFKHNRGDYTPDTQSL